MEKNTEINVEKLISIIVQCFGLVIIGYIFSRFKLITQNQSKGLSVFTSKLSLPALIFISLVNLDFSTVNWKFVFLIFFAKLSIFSVVSIVTLSLTKPANIGLAAIYSIFCTQGNDFAFGYPILSMLYGPEKKEFLDYLYILVPIQLLILNPIGIILLETHVLLNSFENKKEKKNLFFNVFKNLLFNPINFMTFIGIIWNLLIGNKVPVILDSLLDTAAKSFSATALFLLGFNLKGSFQQFKNSKTLVLPVVLVVVKIIVCPLLNRLFVEKGLNIESYNLEEYSSFAFLFGTIPTAPTALIFALEYNLKPDIVASALVICIVLSSPIILISINLVRSVHCFIKNYEQDLGNFIRVTSLISLPCILWVLFIFIIGKKYKYITHRCLILILLAQLLNCLSGYSYTYLSYDDKSKQSFKNHFQYIISVCSLFLIRIWVSILALTIGLLSYRSLCFVLKISKILFIFASIVSVVLCSVVIINPSYPKYEFYINYESCSLEAKIASILLFNALLITIISIIVHQRSFKNFSHQSQYTYSKLDDETPNVNQQCSRSNSIEVSPGPSSSKILDVEDLIADEFNDYCSSDVLCNKKHSSSCRKTVGIYKQKIENAIQVEELEKNEIDILFYKQHQVFPIIVFLLTTALSMFISFDVSMFKMMTGKENGIYMEIQYLDVVLNYGLGVVLFVIFGFDLKVLTKFFSKKSLILNLKNENSIETELICENFKENYLAKCKKEILFKLNDEKKLCYVFKGRDLIRWIVNNKVVLENACKLESLDASKYDLCYSNKTLDLRTNVSLSGIPNNALLTLKPITKARSQSLITVCLQPDIGERKIGEFTDDQTLFEILLTLFPEKLENLSDADQSISCLYMRKEIIGIENLQDTKLRTLGILSGKVAIKVIFNKSCNSNTSPSKSKPNTFEKITKDLDESASKFVSSVQSNLTSKLDFLKKKLANKKKKTPSTPQTTGSLNSQKTLVESSSIEYTINEKLIELPFKNHKIVLYTIDDKNSSIKQNDLSDDFFEVTKDDMRLMYNDLVSKKAELEERPLETQKLRDERLMKEETKYDQTIIRVSLPFDRVVLQTSLKPTDLIEDLVKIVEEFVTEKNFYLYTAPPKKILELKSSFNKEKLFPTAVIQLGGCQKKILKENFQNSISSYTSVFEYTNDIRNNFKKLNQEEKKLEQNSQNDQNKMSKDQKEARLLKLMNMKK